MTLFRRSRDQRPVSRFPEHDMRAVPLSRQDVEVLVAGYTEDDRLTRVHRPDISGSSYRRTQAADVRRAAALAGALGHETVPFPASDVSGLESVLFWLQNALHAANTRAFGLLELKRQALSTLAGRNGWRYQYDREARAFRWVSPVAAAMRQRVLPAAAGDGHANPDGGA